MQRTRWLKREFVPHSKRYGAITERGFGLRPRPGGTGQRNFPWPSASRFCPAVIPLCFNTNADAVVLADSLTAAINSWHQGLGVGEPGNHAGVRFAITQPRVCSAYAIGAADYRVHVIDISTEAVAGCRVLPKHHLLFTIHYSLTLYTVASSGFSRYRNGQGSTGNTLAVNSGRSPEDLPRTLAHELGDFSPIYSKQVLTGFRSRLRHVEQLASPL